LLDAKSNGITFIPKICKHQSTVVKVGGDAHKYREEHSAVAFLNIFLNYESKIWDKNGSNDDLPNETHQTK